MSFRAFALCIAILLGYIGHAKAQATQVTGVSCPESAAYYSKDSINVVTFGASTVEGVNGLNFQSYLTNNFKKCYPTKVINVQNYGVGGETTGQGLLRIDKAIYGKTGFIVILMGANDAIRINAGTQKIEETEANMRELISRSLKQKLIPIISTIQNFDDRKDYRMRKVNMKVVLINNLYKKLAKEYKIYLTDIHAVIRKDFSLYQDIVHPNARGNRLIGYMFFDTINKIIAERFLQFTVTQNYPNPVNTNTSVDIIMPQSDKVDFKIYNMQGKMVKTVLSEYLNTGKHTIPLDLSLLTPGIYIYKVTSSNGLYSTAKKMVIIH